MQWKQKNTLFSLKSMVLMNGIHLLKKKKEKKTPDDALNCATRNAYKSLNNEIYISIEVVFMKDKCRLLCLSRSTIMNFSSDQI